VTAKRSIGRAGSGDLRSLPRGVFPTRRSATATPGNAWCVHDNQHLLNWAAEAVNGYVDMLQEVRWLGRVLEARNFPIDRLARNLDIGADVVRREVRSPAGEQTAAALADAAAFVRSSKTFL
jgi:hypothetical protein